jgi:hypothetical protein
MISDMQSTDLILDTTKAGHFSETVRLFSKRLSIPTLITSYGQKLRNLNEQAQKYILQVKVTSGVYGPSAGCNLCFQSVPDDTPS